MEKSKSLTRYILTAAIIAAAYVALTYFSAAFGIAYGNIQFRLSEALNILAAFTPAAIPGLTIGCILGNIASPIGLIDIVVGAIATFLSALTIRLISKKLDRSLPFVAVLPPTLFNSVFVGLEITLFLSENVSFGYFLLFAAEVALGEMVVCLALGIPLYRTVKRYLKGVF